MFASGPAILSALVLLQAEPQFEIGTRVESRVGEGPTTTPSSQIASPQQFQVMVVATPLLSLRWLDDIDDLRANSATRILWRPVPLLESRPLFLETLEATHARRTSKRGRWQLALRGSFGEEDYTSLTQQFANQPALPAATTMLTLNASGEASWKSSRRTTLGLRLEGLHRRSFDDQSGQNAASGSTSNLAAFAKLPTQTSVTASPQMRHILTRRSSVEALASISEIDIRDIPLSSNRTGKLNALSVQPQVGLYQNLSRTQQLHVVVGLTYAVALSRPDNTTPWHPVTPLFQIDLDSLLHRTRTTIVRSSLNAGTSWYVDPVLGATVLRGIFEARIDDEWNRNWSAGLRGSFATDLTERLPFPAGGIPPDETVVSVEIPFRYRWSNQMLAEFGGRYAERGPHLEQAGFSLRSATRELWLFLNLTAMTARPSTRSL